MLASGKLPPDALPGDLAGQVRFTNYNYYILTTLYSKLYNFI